MDEHISFFNKLDQALQAVMGGGLEALYEAAQSLFQSFRSDTKRQLAEASKEDFIHAVTLRAVTATLPDPKDKKAVAREVLPAMVAGAMDLELANAMQEWSNTQL